MKVHLNTTPVCLAKNQMLSLTEARGSVIRCRRGSIWITQDHDARDVVLSAGESFRLEREGRSIVWALADASVELLPAKQPQSSLAPVLRWLERASGAMPRLATSLRSFA